MKKALTKNEFTTEVQQILQDYRDVLPFQDRVILNRKFTRKGVTSLQTEEVVRELDCNWTDVGNAIQKLINILRVKNKWLVGHIEKLTQADDKKNTAIIGWLNDQRKSNGKVASQLCILRDEEKKTDEKARQQWRDSRTIQVDPKK